MLKVYLDKANEILAELIKLTKDDLENIEKADHSGVQESVNKKVKLSGDFSLAKAKLDKALVELNMSSQKDLSELLSEDEKADLASLKTNLEELFRLNKKYARLVLIVKDFYDRMVKAMFKDNVSEAGQIQNSLLKLKI